ncbi:MAG: hypothetical protein ACKVPJ_03140 [Chitinophagales bacterium]
MIWDDDADDEPGDMNEDELREEMRLQDERIYNLPVMKKAQEIVQLVDSLCDAIQLDDTDITEDKEKLFFRHMLEQIRGDSYILPSKIAGAEGSDLYSLRMENAVIIKKAACEIRSATYSLEMREEADAKYLEVIRNEIDSFKQVFLQWIQSFDKKNDLDDGWGLWK